MATVDGQKVKVGDWVGFKSDIEQYGQITKINGDQLTLKNENGFEGSYIGGQTITVQQANRCWID
jgi:Tfp pilus assembly protein PilP